MKSSLISIAGTIFGVFLIAGGLWLLKAAPPAPQIPVNSAVVVQSSNPKIIWSAPVVTFYILPGDSKSRTLTIEATAPLQNISVTAVPNIAAFLTLTPAAIPSLLSNQTATINIQAVVPKGTPISTNYDGTIQFATGKQTIPQTLKVLISIGLPPDPGPAGKTTLAGIDSDGDGIRDDVQRYIGLTYRQSAKTRAALTQATLALEGEIIGSASSYQPLADAIDCIGSTLTTGSTDVAGGVNARNAYLALRTIVLNTPDRASGFFRANSQFGSGMRPSTPYAERASRCLINPSLFPN